MRAAAVFLLLLMAAGCRTTVYVPVPAVSLDSSYVVHGTRDTVFIRDSVAVTERGDTVVKERERIIYRTRSVADTVFSRRVDTVTVVASPEPVPHAAPSEPRWMMWGAVLAAAVFLIFLRRR